MLKSGEMNIKKIYIIIGSIIGKSIEKSSMNIRDYGDKIKKKKYDH